MMIARASAVLVLSCVVGLAAGCSAKTEAPGKAPIVEISKDPVTIRIANSGSASITDEEFKKLFVEPVQRKHPNITLELIKYGGTTPIKSPGDWVASGVIPDLILHSNGSMGEVFAFDLMADITPLVKQTAADLSRFDPVVLDGVKIASDEGWLVGIPFTQQFSALYYNKDIFDKFGVAYPKDGMTWNDAVELSRSVAKTYDGVAYMGLHPERFIRPAYPLSLTLVDPKTNKAQVNSDGWRTVLQLQQQIASIPGNWDGKAGRTVFWSKQNVAMLGSVNILANLLEAQAQAGFNGWDVAQYPSYPNSPNRYGMVDAWVAIITKQSQHRAQAMQVVNVLTSDEVQLMASRQMGRMSTLVNTEMNKQFGADNPILKEKRLQSIFKSKPVPAPKFSMYEAKARPFLEDNFPKVIGGTIDGNTLIRQAEEQINKMLSQQ
jgi:multiple sugar transport system substrate-binding protein